MASSKKPAKKAASKSAPINKHSAGAADNQLKLYRSMRDFKVTGEPSGSSKTKFFFKTGGSLPFVIQKHAASHLHYDFRLGWNKVLKSWAVAKGPSYYPGDRRLAVQVEDHPWDYRDFEGIIPKGQYGGGTVMVWDTGTWEPQEGYEDVTAALRDGSLKFILKGKKLKGKWTLVRMKPREGSRWGNNGKPNWLLIKEHDDFERGPDDVPITEEKPNSAVTGRTMEQIAAVEDHVWNSNRTTKPAKAVTSSVVPRKSARAPTKSASVAKDDPSLAATLSKLPRESQPAFLPPELALETTSPPESNGWLHELKLDGYRIQARKSGKKVALLTRKGLDWAHRIPGVAQAVAALAVKSATLDGEVVVLGPDGTSDFAALQASFQHAESHPLTYFAFDLLHIEGRNPRGMPLRDRKELLTQILPQKDETLRFSEHIEGNALDIFHHACDLHAEGIISKRVDSPYRGSRSKDWLKSKCLREQEFVIAGYTFSTEGDDRIGSLLLGYYENSRLIYAGRTGTGFTQKLKRSLLQQLSKLQTSKPAFERVPTDARRGAHWIKPKLVAQVRFATWTADNLVRQAAFLGLREDKSAAEVRREEPTVAPKPKASHRTSTPLAAKTLKKSQSKPKISGNKTPGRSAPSTVLVSLRLTHPDKILDPETGLTKQQLADYYAAIAPHILPHIAGRPLSLVRCPEGAGKPCFYQKHVTNTLPPSIGSVEVTTKKTGEPEPYITLDTEEAFIGLAQMSVLEIHPWGSKNDDLEHPDRLIFDFDPDESLPWPKLTAAVAEARKRLKKLGLESFLKLTGGKGLHLVAPMEPKLTWPEIKDFAHKFAVTMERDNPQLFLTKMTKAARTGKIYLDYLRNERGATAVAPFSPRARLGMAVSLPLPWSALKETSRPVFHVHDFASWRSRLRNDPWKSLPTLHQRLDPKKLARM
jgi:bifunctional non-homologous end joining protein LigD